LEAIADAVGITAGGLSFCCFCSVAVATMAAAGAAATTAAAKRLVIPAANFRLAGKDREQKAFCSLTEDRKCGEAPRTGRFLRLHAKLALYKRNVSSV